MCIHVTLCPPLVQKVSLLESWSPFDDLHGLVLQVFVLIKWSIDHFLIIFVRGLLWKWSLKKSTCIVSLHVFPLFLFTSCSRFNQSQIFSSLIKNIVKISTTIILKAYNVKIHFMMILIQYYRFYIANVNTFSKYICIKLWLWLF
jgi:hypothetical protein